MTVGEQIREKRIEKGFTMEQLAKELSVDLSLVSRIEKGTRTPQDKHIKILSNLLELDEKNLHVLITSDSIVKQYKGKPYIALALERATAMIAAMFDEAAITKEKKKSKK